MPISSEVKNKISKLLEERKVIEDEIERLSNLPHNTPTEELAIILHNTLCHYNHTDGCDWYYDIRDDVHRWNGHAHRKYLNMAKTIESRGYTPDDAIEILKICKGNI